MSSQSFATGNNNKIIISFSGHGMGMGTLPKFEFVNFLEKHYSNYDRRFYLDKYNKWYHKGIDGISTNIDETLTHLKKIIRNYEKVIFIGCSAGGYAAILFGSLLKVHKVIAFKPQTIIKSQSDIDDTYKDLKIHINSTTKYYIFGDKTIDNIHSFHHISHCHNINIYPNVHLNSEYEVDLKKLRDSGVLKDIMKNAIKGANKA